MEAPVVKKVVVTGGGTAGWVTAAALAQQFGSLLDITLVESEEIGTVGVGEATFPSIQSFHRLLDLDEQEFMRASKASFKLAISFENWGGLGDRYLHAFGTIGRSTWMGDFQHFWLAAQEDGFRRRPGRLLFRAAGGTGRQVRDVGSHQDQLRLSLRRRDCTRPIYASSASRRASSASKARSRVSSSIRKPDSSRRSFSSPANRCRATCLSTARDSAAC